MSVTKVSSPMIESGTKGADIASAATVVIGTDGSYFDITGTTGISTQFTVDAGRRFTLQFDGAVTITDNAAITLSGAANFTTAAGDILSFVAVAANTVVQTGYSLVDGGSPVAPAAGGDYKLLYTHDASAATWTFNSSTGVDVATYGAYVFVLATVFNASNDARLQIEVSDDDGSSWKSTGYQYWNRSIDQDGTLETHLSTSDSEIQVTTGGFRSATAQGGLTGTIFAPHNGSESGKSFMTWVVSCQMYSGYDYMTTWGGGEYNAGVFDSGGADAWRFSVSSGNISGTMKMYGYK
jgi:hypothetical protein